MIRRRTGLVLPLLVLLSSAPAVAKHPVREIPVRFVRLQPEYGWTDTDDVERQLEFANRVYANAGIRFTYDPDTVFLDVWDDDLNCWFDDVQDDEATASFYADTDVQHLVTIVHYRAAQAPGKPCVTADCLWDFDCCPDDFDEEKWVCDHGVACLDLPGWPAAPWGVCGPSTCQGPGADCFGEACMLQQCELGAWSFMRFYPLTNNPFIGIFAHEAGHHFGLAHTFDPPEVRCYDTSEGTVPEHCGEDLQWPGTPGTCVGGLEDCPSNAPYRNIMSYFGDCSARYAGDDTYVGASGWNKSLSPSQVSIITRSLDEFWDDYLDFYGDARLYEYGGWGHMQAALAYGTLEYEGLDSWNTVLATPIADPGWTRGNLRLTQGDFNGDGRIDVVAVTPNGNHPGVSLWLRNQSGTLVYSSMLVAGSGYGSNAVVTAGNFQGDMADDVVVQSSSSFLTFNGQIGATSMSYQHYRPWPHTTHRVVVGNFTGGYELPVPMPAWQVYHGQDKHQDDAEPPVNRWNNISHDDIVVLGPTTFEIYAGSSYLSLSSPYQTTTAYAQSGAWAGNVCDDYHDELLIRASDSVRVIRGQRYFSFWSQEPSIWVGTQDPVLVSLGDFTVDHHADILMTSWQHGTRLYYGGPSTYYLTSLDWSHLNPGNIRHAVADFIRGGRDDVMLSATWGSYLYAGAPSPQFMVGSVWSSTGLQHPNVEWFGRR